MREHAQHKRKVTVSDESKCRNCNWYMRTSGEWSCTLPSHFLCSNIKGARVKR